MSAMLDRAMIAAGNKAHHQPLFSRQVSVGGPPPSESGAVSVSINDQLIAVLPRLRRFARGLAGSAVEADDLVQAACERALTRAHQFQEGTRFDSWMFRIVQTIWIDQLRSRDTRREEAEEHGVNVGTDEPGRRVEARLALQEVRTALEELPLEQRAALLLVTVDGLSYKEAAEVADVPVGTIMSRLARARVALQAKLDAGGGLRRSTNDAKAK
ncbi:MAG TPA: RNA polymerase sigma factor [Stellaceae bacterium]|jgi:RNA polymerase sigma-70 factor (ECF subfamily)|nr:RNA polymerase sigma factor [Stellaceae bacterium]